MEFLADMVTRVPANTSALEVDGTKDREAIRASELAAQGHLIRLWKPPVQEGEWRTLGLWRADDVKQLQGLLATLPLHVWMKVRVTPLLPHPNDPGPFTG